MRHADRPLWGGCDSQVGKGSQIEPVGDLAVQPAPDYEVNQRINWGLSKAAILNGCGMALRHVHAAQHSTLLITKPWW